MADNVIPFHNNDEENERCCSSCDLAHEFTLYTLEAVNNGSYDEVFNILRELVSEAKKLALVEYLQSEVVQKMEIVDHLLGECHCGDEDLN